MNRIGLVRVAAGQPVGAHAVARRLIAVDEVGLVLAGGTP